MADVEDPKETALADEAPAAAPVKDVSDTGASEEADEGKGGGGKSLLVYYNALSRVVMAAFLIAAGTYALPDVIVTTPTSDFKNCAIFFIIGTGLFLIDTILDFIGSIQGGLVAMANASLYIFGSAALVAGSVAFYPGIMDGTTCYGYSPCPLGQYLYIAGTCTVAFALLWDTARLLRSGNVIPVPFIVAIFSALLGAINFNLGANFLMPQYQSWPDGVQKGGTFFVVGGIFFMIHALAVVKAYLL